MSNSKLMNKIFEINGEISSLETKSSSYCIKNEKKEEDEDEENDGMMVNHLKYGKKGRIKNDYKYVYKAYEK